MPLGRVYIAPSTAPVNYVTSLRPVSKRSANNKFNSTLGNDDDNNEAEDFLVRNNNLRNQMNTSDSNKLNFNYGVDINEEPSERYDAGINSGKAFRNIEIKILDTKYDEECEDNVLTNCNIKEGHNFNGNISFQSNQNSVMILLLSSYLRWH